MQIITEATNRQKLRQTTRIITSDIMDVLRGDWLIHSETQLEEKAWDAGLIAGDLVLGVLLGPYTWLPKIDTSDYELEEELEEYFMVSVGISIDELDGRINVAGLGWAHDEDGDILPGIDVRVRLPMLFNELLGTDKGMVQREVMNTVAHELEHLTQKDEFKAFDRAERYYEGIPIGLTGSETFEYLIKPEEVAAHVIGYSTHSKSKQELKQEIEGMVKSYQISGQLTKQEADQILDVWFDWADRNLQQMKFNIR